MTTTVPDAALATAASVHFHVSADMVATFAALTGDHSSLHVDATFARRSAYRRTVVHGMLPIGFLPMLAPCRIEGFHCVPRALTGRFTAPVYVDDHLTLTAAAGRPQSGGHRVVFDFRIDRDASGETVTRGALAVAYRHGPVGAPTTARGSAESLLLHALEVNRVRLEDISKGQQDRIVFRVSQLALRRFMTLIAGGLAPDAVSQAAEVADRFAVTNLLAVLLFSTSVGTSLPGAAATFLEFSAEVERDVDGETDYWLDGEVAHRSMATRIVKKDLVVRRADGTDGIPLRGRVAALVASPSPRMPTMAELRDVAGDRGLQGKVVVITGASRGIGETTAKLFALAGARVVVNYRQGAEDADRVVGDIVQGGGEACAIAADVTQPDDVRKLVDAAVQRYGSVHILVNNAARDFRPIPFLTLTWDEVQRDIDVIAKGAFLCCQRVIPLMLQQGGGKIVNISSVATDAPPADQTKYVMAKSALVGLTRSLAVELAPKNIQVNLVVPSFVETDLVAHVPEGFRRQLARESPMQRLGTAVEVAQAVVFLASSQASYTTGQRFFVTGGGAPFL